MQKPGKNILVIAENAIGDCIMMLPALRALSRNSTEGFRLLVSPNKRESVFFEFEKQIELWTDYTSEGDYIFPSDENIRRASGGCDSLVNLCTWWNDFDSFMIDGITAYSVAETKFESYPSSLRTHDLLHAFENYFKVVNQIFETESIENYVAPVMLPSEAIGFAKSIKERLGTKIKLLGIHSYSRPDKTMTSCAFPTEINKFLVKNPDWVIVNLDPIKGTILDAVSREKVLRLYGRPLSYYLAMVNVCDAFIGVDSCFLHAADLARIPSVGLFSPTSPKIWGLKFSKGLNLCADSMSLFEGADINLALGSLMHEVNAQYC
ncbi:hypothetical protein [Cellvibrio sp. UBA7671]|uniref:glycosyltransferase family 9 protein n=1 Tax=Cellvibrio sp. UBA7671 TaxID=1946312 RepID=UPI002F353959